MPVSNSQQDWITRQHSLYGPDWRYILCQKMTDQAWAQISPLLTPENLSRIRDLDNSFSAPINTLD